MTSILDDIINHVGKIHQVSIRPFCRSTSSSSAGTLRCTSATRSEMNLARKPLPAIIARADVKVKDFFFTAFLQGIAMHRPIMYRCHLPTYRPTAMLHLMHMVQRIPYTVLAMGTASFDFLKSASKRIQRSCTCTDRVKPFQIAQPKPQQCWPYAL